MYYGPNDASRIHRDVFIISTSILYALTLVAVGLRFWIHVHFRKRFSLDDTFLLLALSTLTATLCLVHVYVIKYTYLIAALLNGMYTGNEEEILNLNIDEMMRTHLKFLKTASLLGWLTVMASKFSFLFFFKKLIAALRSLNIFWWITTIFNLIAFGYGALVGYVGCPPFRLTEVCGLSLKEVVAYSISHMMMDLLGDLLILAIPIAIVSRINIHWTRKISLMLSLGLTVFLVAITIIRVSGMLAKGTYNETSLSQQTKFLDFIWVSYWSLLSAEVAVFMAAALSFRSFFVARHNNKNRRDQARRFFAESFARGFNRKRILDLADIENDANAPSVIPQAHLVGVRTSIDGQGRSGVDANKGNGTLFVWTRQHYATC